MHYKVEECDPDSDHYLDISLPDAIGTFDTVEQAEAFQWKLVSEYADERTKETSSVRPHQTTDKVR